MRRAFEQTVTIKAPADRVWHALVDWEHAPRWMRGVDAMSADGPTAAGTHVTFSARGRVRRGEILVVEDGRRVALRSTQGPVTADYTYEVEQDEVDQRTRVSLTAGCEVRGPLGLLAPVLRRLMAHTDADQLDQLRHVVERDA